MDGEKPLPRPGARTVSCSTVTPFRKSRFETRFGVKSQEFYEAIMRGDLEEFDALDDYRMEFIEWLALYKTWLSLDEKYCQVIARQPVVLQIKANLMPAPLP